jgi:hypothetical protein
MLLANEEDQAVGQDGPLHRRLSLEYAFRHPKAQQEAKAKQEEA